MNDAKICAEMFSFSSNKQAKLLIFCTFSSGRITKNLTESIINPKNVISEQDLK